MITSKASWGSNMAGQAFAIISVDILKNDKFQIKQRRSKGGETTCFKSPTKRRKETELLAILKTPQPCDTIDFIQKI